MPTKKELHNIAINTALIDKGAVLRSNQILSFKLFGNLYTTNRRRRRRYSFDDGSWKLTDHSWFYKVQMVLAKKAFKMNKKRTVR